MTELLKIARACFIGGAVCCGVALLVAPVFWWLGLFAGFAGGYVAYEFRDVVGAARQAFRSAIRGTKIGVAAAPTYIVQLVTRRFAETLVWWKQPHPIFYPAAALVAPFFLYGLYAFGGAVWEHVTHSTTGIVLAVFTITLGLGEAYFFLVMAVQLPILIFAFIGARAGEHSYWTPLMMAVTDEDRAKAVQSLTERGYSPQPFTYGNVLRWTALGIGITVKFFVWTVWKHLAIVIWQCVKVVGLFFWHLGKLIHSNERVLCGLDGTVGGAAVYLTFASPTMSPSQQVVLILCGGLVGAAVGIVHWKASQRLFASAPNGA